MSDRPKGWHPDPFGIHAERYYYADGKPGRLVRDGARTESYDDPPENWRDLLPDTGAETNAQPRRQGGSTASARVAPHEQRTPEPLPRKSETKIHTFPEQSTGPTGPPREGGGTAVSASIPDSEQIAQASGAVPGPVDPEGDSTAAPRHAPEEDRSQRLTDLGASIRQYWAVGGVLLLVLVVVFAFVVLLPSSPKTKGGDLSAGPAKTTNEGLSVAPTPSAGRTDTTVRPTAWTITGTYPTSSLSLNGLACSSVDSCEAVGETTLQTALLLTTTNGGVAWIQQRAPEGVGALDAVTCPSATMCIAVGGNTVVTTTDGGASWTVQLLGNQNLTAVTCFSTTSCMAVGGTDLPDDSDCQSSASYATQDGGLSWSTSPVPCVDALGVACSTATTCDLAGVANLRGQRNGEILESATAGRKWQVAYRADKKDSALSAITCPTTQACEAAGRAGTASIVGTTDGGHAWVPQRVPGANGTTAYSAIFCESATVCVATGSAPPLSTGDGGSTWARQSLPESVGAITGVSCSTETTCTGVGDARAAPGGVTLSFMQ